MEGFAPAFEAACLQHGWHLDVTTRACGDCGFHAVVVLQSLLAKQSLPARKPKGLLKALANSECPEAVFAAELEDEEDLQPLQL